MSDETGFSCVAGNMSGTDAAAAPEVVDVDVEAAAAAAAVADPSPKLTVAVTGTLLSI